MTTSAKGRPINGVLLLDKPLGISSNKALQVARAIFNARKGGHTGALDPLASGLLPLCFGEATKFSQYLLDSDKRYLATVKLGVVTASGDAEGEILERHPVDVTEQQLVTVVKQFEGVIEQVPSMYSALKHQGQPLYKLARQGIEVERKARKITIYGLELLAIRDDEIDIDVRCSKGTYIRSLAEDIGKELGCGAHVVKLHRIEAGPYKAAKMISLDALQSLSDEQGQEALDALLLESDSAIASWPSVKLDESSSYCMRQGKTVAAIGAPTGEPSQEGLVRIFDEHNKFVGVGEILDDGRVKPRRLMNTGAM